MSRIKSVETDYSAIQRQAEDIRRRLTYQLKCDGFSWQQLAYVASLPSETKCTLAALWRQHHRKPDQYPRPIHPELKRYPLFDKYQQLHKVLRLHHIGALPRYLLEDI